jgi:hypothetical protein
MVFGKYQLLLKEGKLLLVMEGPEACERPVVNWSIFTNLIISHSLYTPYNYYTQRY